MSCNSLISRIAPTPSGYLHFGNAYNFILTWWFVRKRQGKLLLRIDDFDTKRCRDEYLEDIFHSLEWLGIDYDLGPMGVENFKKKWSQSLKRDHYFKELENFSHFVCECSRGQIKAISKDGSYPGTCYYLENLFEKGKKIRFKGGKLNKELATSLRDMILWSADDTPTYQLSSLVDDKEAGVNFIVRGEDLRESSEAQRVLAKSISWDFPAKENILHHPLLKDSKGEKLSKSLGSFSLAQFREEGGTLEELINYWSETWGLALGEITNLEDLLEYEKLGGWVC